MSAKILIHAPTIALCLFAAAGCATKIVPPPSPAQPATVYVTDYGRHSSLLLPVGEGQLVEYTYGDWNYCALNNYRWYNGATALLFSESSTLGRRYLPHPSNEIQLRQLVESKRLLTVRIEEDALRSLLHELDERYNRRIDSLVYNDSQHTYFVRDDSHYGVFNNCNRVTADWLEKLGCEVKGVPVLSNFRLKVETKPAAENDATPAENKPSAEPPPAPVHLVLRPTTRPLRLSQ